MWQTTTAELIASGVLEIGDGYRAKNEEFRQEGLPFARVQNVDGGFDLSNADLFPLDSLGRVGSKVSQVGDCVLTTKGSVGRVAFVNARVDQFVYSPQLSYWRSLDGNVLSPLYLRYWLQGPEFLVQCAAVKGSTDMADYVNLRDQRSMTITLPGLSTQARIGGVLGAIDDLIENNRRRVELLEQMAQAIYREWFAHFRYPGHEHDELVDSPLGPIPGGWKTTTLGAAGRWLSGGTPSTSNPDFWGGDIPWITSGSLTSILLDRSERRVTEAGLANGTRLVQRDALLFVVRGMSLVREFRVGMADVPIAFGQDCKAIVARPGIEPLYLGFAVISMASEIQGMVELAGHGTGKLSTDRLQAIEIPEPAAAVQSAFTAVVDPLRRAMSTIRDQTDRLVEIRDLLLPRLVTGKIDVSKLDLDAVLEGAVG